MRLRKIAIQGEADGKGYVTTYTIRLKKEVDKPWETNEPDGKAKVRGKRTTALLRILSGGEKSRLHHCANARATEFGE